MLLDHNFYWKGNDKNKDGFSAHILPFGHNNETFAKILGNLLLTIWMQIDKGKIVHYWKSNENVERRWIIDSAKSEKYVHSSSKKNRNYARSHKIGMSKLVMKVMGNVSTGLHNTKLARSNSIYAVSSRVATPV